MRDVIIAFDPGGTTGVCVFTQVNYLLQMYQYAPVLSQELPWDQRRNAYSLLTTLAPRIDRIVIEDFNLYPDRAMDQARSKMPSPKMIERLLVYAELLELADRVTMQGAALRLNVKIPASDYQRVPTSKHCRDAYMHARYYFIVESKRQQKLAVKGA